jgi:hypothetical protein
MVGKKSGRALLREEGTLSAQFYRITLSRSAALNLCLSAFHRQFSSTSFMISADWPMRCMWEGAMHVLTRARNRPGTHRQQHGVFDVAAGEHDQSKELLHVCLLLSFLRIAHPWFGISVSLRIDNQNGGKKGSRWA